MFVGVALLGILPSLMGEVPLAALLVPSTHSVAVPGVDLTVEISVPDNRGVVLLGVFADADGYKADDPVEFAHLTLSGSDGEGAVKVTFRGLRPGTYALKAFQDLDGDEKIDTNLVGYPTEPFGFSNNAPVRFGPPSFERASFPVQKANTFHAFSLD